MKNLSLKMSCVVVSSLLAGSAVASHSVTSVNDSNQYMGAPVNLVEVESGVIINEEVVQRAHLTSYPYAQTEEIADGVWVFGGYALAPIAAIDTKDGIILFDTGDSEHDAQKLHKALREVTDKPIIAIIYGHSHTAFGAQTLTEGNTEIPIIGHPGLNDVVNANLKAGGPPAYFQEIGPYLAGRALTQFNFYLPESGPDASYLDIDLHLDELNFVPVNTPVEDQQEMVIGGETMRFLTRYGSDDKVHTAVWFPEREMLLTTLLWMGPPQLYSVRGDVFRDPREWITGLKEQRDLEPEILISATSRPVVGKDLIQEQLNGYIDGASYVIDQTLRGINLGMGPEELGHFVRFPEYLSAYPNNFQGYGEVMSYPKAIYHKAVGWYDNDAANLKTVTPFDEAERLVPLLGGRETVLSLVDQAVDIKEFAWAAQLVNYLYILDNYDEEVRLKKAEVLREMGYRATGQNDRSHLISQARSLEGHSVIARNIYPPATTVQTSPNTYVDYLRVRLDPLKSGEDDIYVVLDVGGKEPVGLHIRRAVAEFVENIEQYVFSPDMSVSMDAESWSKLYLNQISVDELIEADKIHIKGERVDFSQVYDYFDNLETSDNWVIPPLK